MHPTVRDFYNLEEIWGGKPVRLKREAPQREAPKRKAPRKKAKRRAKAPGRRRSR